MLSNTGLDRVLYINLNNNSFRIEKRTDLFDRYIGGTGVAAALLTEECPVNTDPLGPDNPIIFAVGPLTGVLPLASKTVAMFKSPLTGNLGESHCGGRSAIAIRMAGYGAIVIKGVSEIPIYLSISDKGVEFRNASTIWGMESSFTVGRIIRENETGTGLRTIMRIGGAGERLVRYACVTTETYRHFGRLGLGAVFGSKKLKAVVAYGKHSIPVPDGREYKQLYDELYTSATKSTVMQKYHDLGTADNVLPLNSIGGLPTRNLTETKFEGAQALSGQNLAANFLGRRLACSHCPVGCIHIAALREPYSDESYFYKTSMISYDYEMIYSLGSMLGISEPQGFLKLLEKVEKFGMDAMSAGVVLAWATEAFKNGLVKENDTLGLHFDWGGHQSFLKAIDYINEQPNDFYKALARGVAFASEKYGGKEYALSFGGNEMPGYHTGPAAHIGVLAGLRHSHLDNAGYSIDQKILTKRTMKAEELADALVKEECWRQVLSSLVICFFARGLYEPLTVVRSLKLAGMEYTEKDLEKAGKEIYLLKTGFKTREGFSLQEQQFPERIFSTVSPVGTINKEFVRSVIEEIAAATNQ